MGLGLPLVAYLVWSAGGRCRLYNRREGPGITVELVFGDVGGAARTNPGHVQSRTAGQGW